SLARKVLADLGMNVSADSKFWTGPTTFAHGGDSIAELSKAIESELRDVKRAPVYKEKVVIKGAVADGEEGTFDAALKRPPRPKALGRIVALALAPAARLVGQVLGPGASLSSQLKTISKKAPASEAAAASPPA